VQDFRWLAARVIACAIGWSALALPATGQDFPVVFDSPSKLRLLGIAVSFGKNVPPLTNKCYYYGDGGYLISTSDEFYDRFKRRGFSIGAMCFGLVSETRYDPESGRRLPTYVLTDPELIKENKRQFGAVVEPGAISSELPLDLPNCFKNANPYTDCEFRFGRMTGKPLTAAQTDAYKRLGAAIDKAMSVKIQGMPAEERLLGKGEGEELVKNFRKTSGYSMPSDIDGALPKELLRNASASIWVRSSKFARGYGYGLDADGAAGPSANPAALKAVLEQQSKPQIDVQRLRQMLNANRP
jgi:hypothetical protein